MPTTISGTAITVGSIDLTTPLATADGGTGSSTISPYQMVLGTAQATTSGTSLDFTGIPSWVKRITVTLSGGSTNGTSNKLIQLGAGSVITTGYESVSSTNTGSSVNVAGYSTGFGVNSGSATEILSGMYVFEHHGGNVWVGNSLLSTTTTAIIWTGSGKIALSGTLDRIRLTTVNGTDTFDAGSVNIMYEGY